VKKIFIILALLAATNVVNAETVDFSATTPYLTDDGNIVVFDGVRVDGFGFSLKEDALKLKFKFDLNSTSFKLDTADITAYKGIGVYSDQCMVNDAPVTSITTNDEGQEIESRQPSYTTNAETSYKKDGEIFTIAAGDLIESGGSSYRFNTSKNEPFVAEFNLQPNQVMSWYLNNKSQGLIYQLTGPESDVPGEVVANGINGEGPLMIGPIRVVKAGVYKLKIETDPQQRSTSFLFKSFNSNENVLKTIVNNTRLNEFLEGGSLDCSKFKVSLNRDEILTFPAPKSDDLVIKLVNDQSQVIAQATGSELVYKETERNSDYYIFIYSKSYKRATYSNKVKIVLEKPEEANTKK